VLALAGSAFVAVLPRTHPLADRGHVSLAELAAERWIDSPDGFGNRIAVDRAIAAAGLSRTVTAEVADLGTIPRFVPTGLGIAVLPEITYRATPDVTTLPITDHGVDWIFSAVSRPAPSLAVTALLEQLEVRVSERDRDRGD
jgi:DNA-binding transcriptional LysR family regulator